MQQSSSDSVLSVLPDVKDPVPWLFHMPVASSDPSFPSMHPYSASGYSSGYHLAHLLPPVQSRLRLVVVVVDIVVEILMVIVDIVVVLVM